MNEYQIDTSGLFALPDPDALETAVSPLVRHAQGMINAVQAASSEWSALADAYVAPEAPVVLALFKPVTQTSDNIRSGMVTVFSALMRYAETVRELRRKRQLLLDDIADFHRRMEIHLGQTPSWDPHSSQESFGSQHTGQAPLMEHSDLLRRVSVLVSEHEEAQRLCEFAVRGVHRWESTVPPYYPGGTATDPALDHARAELRRMESGGGDPLAMLALWKTLTPGQLLDYGMAESDYLRSGFRSPPPVAQVKAWWAGLTTDQQAALVVAAPGVIGNLNGIPYAARAKANKANVDAVYKDPRTTAEHKAVLQEIYDALEPRKDNDEDPAAPRSIVSFTPEENGKPLVAVAIGDLDTASNVTWNVPGMKTTVADGLESWTKSAQDLYDIQEGELAGTPGHSTVAVVSWVGYDSPEEPPSSEVLSTELAKAGGVKLSIALDGFVGTRESVADGRDKPHLNVVAHSYGTTTASYALISTTHSVDTVTFFGSAGIAWRDVGSAMDLHVAKDADGRPDVFVTASSEDRVAPFGIIGSGLRGREGRLDPLNSWFGGKNFSSEGGYDPDTGEVYWRTTGHDANGWAVKGSGNTLFAATRDHGYLDPSTESAHNIALTSTGKGGQIKKLIPLRRELVEIRGEMAPLGRSVERDLTPQELREELGK
ncbi:alpha/beta hydrolase [Paenarthrobacter sp. NPDC090520]|uniref:alpha/beta hydrolase n=2 Tax=unclassified Paenarthrobacter TaxID=2634190 RepID=UPI0037F8AE1E